MPAGRGLGPRGFLTEDEKQEAPKISKELIFRILKYLKSVVSLLRRLEAFWRIINKRTDTLRICSSNVSSVL